MRWRRGASYAFYICLAPACQEIEGDAAGAGAKFQARHATSFERVAVVSDEDWLRPALSTLSFLLPGRAKGFRVADLDAAKAWLVEG